MGPLDPSLDTIVFAPGAREKNVSNLNHRAGPPRSGDKHDAQNAFRMRTAGLTL